MCDQWFCTAIRVIWTDSIRKLALSVDQGAFYPNRITVGFALAGFIVKLFMRFASFIGAILTVLFALAGSSVKRISWRALRALRIGLPNTRPRKAAFFPGLAIIHVRGIWARASHLSGSTAAWDKAL